MDTYTDTITDNDKEFFSAISLTQSWLDVHRRQMQFVATCAGGILLPVIGNPCCFGICPNDIWRCFSHSIKNVDGGDSAGSRTAQGLHRRDHGPLRHMGKTDRKEGEHLICPIRKKLR